MRTGGAFRPRLFHVLLNPSPFACFIQGASSSLAALEASRARMDTGRGMEGGQGGA